MEAVADSQGFPIKILPQKKVAWDFWVEIFYVETEGKRNRMERRP
jgi:hypothetical protein